jgi:peptidyl-prolyl cis-trans isomerase D
LVKWAFDAKKGEISDPLNIGDQFIVATVDKIMDEGIQDLQTARPKAEVAIREEKKGEEIIKKLGNAPTFETVMTAYAIKDTTTGADSSIIFSSKGIVNAIGGQEPKVIGACFNKENQTKVSAPILGKSGVYLLKVNSIGMKAADTPEQLAQRRKQGSDQLRNEALSNWFDGLKSQATIKDSRSKVY